MSLDVRDIYYRGYRLSIWNEGKPTGKVHIYAMGDSEVLSIVPTVADAEMIVDDYHEAP